MHVGIQVQKSIQFNEWGLGDGMHHAKNSKNKEIPLAILSRASTILCLNMYNEGLRMIALISLIVLLHIRIVHPIPTPPFIQLNDFCTF